MVTTFTRKFGTLSYTDSEKFMTCVAQLHAFLFLPSSQELLSSIKTFGILQLWCLLLLAFAIEIELRDCLKWPTLQLGYVSMVKHAGTLKLDGCLNKPIHEKCHFSNKGKSIKTYTKVSWSTIAITKHISKASTV